MDDFTVAEAINACGGRFFGKEEDKEKIIKGVERDSRMIGKDWLFVAIKGDNNDGHDYIPSVFEAGALCVLSEKELVDPKGSYILVDDSVKAFQMIAKAYRKKLQDRGVVFIGITGSVGKTSTKEMIYNVLSAGFNASRTQGNYNNGIGVPLTICAVDPSVKTAIVEMGINHYGEMDLLGDMVAPDIMVYTNIGESHIGNFGSREGIFKGKTEVIAHMKDGAFIIINEDDDQLIKLKGKSRQKVYGFSVKNEDADVFLKEVEEKGIYGSDITLVIDKEEGKVHLPIPGMHMAINAAAAALVGKVLGMNREDIFKGIGEAAALPGRGRIIRQKGMTFIDETYNASPKAVKAAIDLLMTANERKVAVLGDMFELGDEEKRLHYETGFYAGKNRPDVIICIGELSKDIYEGAKYALKNGIRDEIEKDKEIENETIVKWFATKEDFIAESDEYIKKGDAVLFKASHGMHFEELLKIIQEKDF